MDNFKISIEYSRNSTGARKGTSHELTSNELNWRMSDRRMGVKLKHCFKIMNNEMPQYFQTLIPEKITFGTKRPVTKS